MFGLPKKASYIISVIFSLKKLNVLQTLAFPTFVTWNVKVIEITKSLNSEEEEKRK